MMRKKKGGTPAARRARSSVKNRREHKITTQDSGRHTQVNLEKNLRNMSEQEVRELLMITLYKMALLRSQVEALNSILIRNKIASYEELWKETNNNMRNAV
jgi:hypothetical protein